MDCTYTGQLIAQKRKEKNLTQRELADKLHVTDKAVSKWERGVNFPDLGILEALAAALDTTPANLLGLEQADQSETLSALTEIYSEQLESHQKSLAWMGWGGIVIAFLLVAVCQFIPRHTVQAYQLLYWIIPIVLGSCLYTLFQCGQIKKWDVPELLLFWGSTLPIVIYLFIQFTTGSGPHPVLGALLILIASVNTQFFFFRTMKPGIMKALPAIVTLVFALWRTIGSKFIPLFWVPALGCIAAWVLYKVRQRTYWRKTETE